MNEYTINWGLQSPMYFFDKSCGSFTLALICNGKVTIKITNPKLTWNNDLEAQIFNDVHLMAREYIQSVITRTKDFSTLNKDLNYKEFKEQYKTTFEQKGYDITSITFNPQLTEETKSFIEEKNCLNNLETNSNMDTSNLKSEVQDKNSNDIETSNSNNFNVLLLIGIVIIVLLLITLLIRKKKNS